MLVVAGRGSRLYVGSIVTAEVERRGMTPSAANERLVRDDLRIIGGMGVLARASLPVIERMLQEGNILVDAIYNEEERSIYSERFGSNLTVIAIRTPTDIRAERLSERSERPLTPAELAIRDAYEMERLRLGDVLQRSDHEIENAGSLHQLKYALKAMLAALP